MTSKKGLILVFIAALLLSIGGLCIKQIPWQPLAINSFRSIISVALLVVFAKLIHRPFKLTKGVVVGALSVWGATTLYTVATKLTTAGNAVLLQFTAPMFVILLVWLVFKERPKKLDVIACVFIFGGVLCFFLDSLGSGRFVGDVIAVLSGVCYAGVFLMNKMPGGDPLWATILGQSLGGSGGFAFPGAGDAIYRFLHFLRRAAGGLPAGLAYALLTTGLQYAKPVSASLVTGIEPVLNPILVALVVGGDPDHPLPHRGRHRFCQRDDLQCADGQTGKTGAGGPAPTHRGGRALILELDKNLSKGF